MTRRQRSWPARVTAAVVLFCVLGGLAFAEANAQARSREDLQERFAVRSATLQAFLETYVGYVLDRERTLAEQDLGASTVTQEQFDSYRQTMAFGASVLLDATGRVITAAPRLSAVIGTNMAAGNADLTAAENGRRAVSDGGARTTDGLPTVTFVTSFDSSVGARIVSGSVDMAAQPLGEFLRHGLPLTGSDVYLVDSKGEILGDSSGRVGQLGQVDGALAQAMERQRSGGTYQNSDGSGDFFVSAAVAETPWRLVLKVPTASLLEPLNTSSRILPWLFLIALSLAATALAVLLVGGRENRRRLEVVALVDRLTAIPNRRASEDYLVRMLSTAHRQEAPLGLLMIDVDNFKRYNDTFGHATGDEVLHSVAARIQGCLRAADVVGRWGGEEFVVLAPMSDAEGTSILAERVREGVASLLPSMGTDVHVTVSIGAALSNHDDDAGTLLGRADAALYQAKQAGRDCVVVAVDPLPSTLASGSWS